MRQPLRAQAPRARRHPPDTRGHGQADCAAAMARVLVRQRSAMVSVKPIRAHGMVLSRCAVHGTRGGQQHSQGNEHAQHSPAYAASCGMESAEIHGRVASALAANAVNRNRRGRSGPTTQPRATPRADSLADSSRRLDD